MDLPQNIRKLDEAVINRIAAGEIIQRPANALKELIENSLDAKSTNIQITVKNGGLKLLQIQDNGTGIRKDNFEIVCERFTTSKLEKFEDLSSIATYGFRGEALASISHIAHLSITSKTSNEVCAYTASYVDGKIQENPKPVAGNQGTIITVEDLFYNMIVRKKALRSPAEEYQKISEVVSKYAIHNAKVSFSLKKSGENNDIRTPPNSNTVENIRIIYGNSIARELIDFSLENEPLSFKAKGFVTNVNYSSKKIIFLLFINHRLVDCQSLRKCIDQVYTTYLPKNSHPFVYMSLEINPTYVDVNVHPTKHEVHFLNEDQVIEAVVTALESKLLGSNNSRVFYTQAKLPGVQVEPVLLKDKEKSQNEKLHKTINPKDLVRTDAKEQKLDKFFGSPVIKTNEEKSSKKEQNISLTEEQYEMEHENFIKAGEEFENKVLNKTVQSQEEKCDSLKSTENKKILTSISKISRCATELTSVLELRKSIEENCHKSLRETFAQHVFVGVVDPNRALLQHNTKLYLCDTKKILRELLYQFVIYNFQNLGSINLSEKISIQELALIALDLPETNWTPEDGPKEELAQRVAEILIDHSEMLGDYFSMEIDKSGNLCSVPLLLDNYFPSMTDLPMYIIRLATEVNWDSEKDCFDTFARETARYYAIITLDTKFESNDWQWVVQQVVYPAIKDFFIPPKEFTENAAILEIANLPSLYKVFERC
ncbi:DNA mismatch repair protein Mlh1 [Coccinella septempunctata]|uniref:DNA mismatch repair protein Mlh1 n=1 Tax=Coccinella septempunctata TaxID=41139 RepID=UPI001D09864F|nr:DNA mismatch repair protein Mlh1 [Coccinella septempunctata]